MDAEKALQNKVVVMNGFTQPEILKIMRAVKSMYEDPSDLIFATTTKNNLQFTLGRLIEDLSEDHEYLKNNPPPQFRHPSGAEGSSEQR